jgi:hypothetical protein
VVTALGYCFADRAKDGNYNDDVHYLSPPRWPKRAVEKDEHGEYDQEVAHNERNIENVRI